MRNRDCTPAERAAFARHEAEQRRREALELTFTQRIDWLHEANQLAWELYRMHPLRHRLDPATLHPFPPDRVGSEER
jgi:hypothetical protein